MVPRRVIPVDHREREPEPRSNNSGPNLSEAEAAEYLGMSRAWLKKSRTRRFLESADAPPFVRNGRRRIVYRRADLDEWQRQHFHRVGALRDSEV
jgi:predicted DNA-binding transcriptional regulator AlpA